MSSCTSIANLHSEDESIKSQGTAKRDDIDPPENPAGSPHEVFVDYAVATASDLEHLYQPGQNGVEPGADKPLSGKVKRSDQFPMKLHVMLTVVEDLGLAHIVSWKVHGRAFQVHNVELFVSKILPRFFRQSKITSFQRQLNLYGFQRFMHGKDTGASYHQFFLRGKPFLCRAMCRMKVKGVSKRSTRKASERKGMEPDFYMCEFLPQLSPTARTAILEEFYTKKGSRASFLEFVECEEEDDTTKSPKEKKRVRRSSSSEQQQQTHAKQPRNWKHLFTATPPLLSSRSRPSFQTNVESYVRFSRASIQQSVSLEPLRNWRELSSEDPAPHTALGFFFPQSIPFAEATCPTQEVLQAMPDPRDKDLTNNGYKTSPLCQLESSEHDEAKQYYPHFSS